MKTYRIIGFKFDKRGFHDLNNSPLFFSFIEAFVYLIKKKDQKFQLETNTIWNCVYGVPCRPLWEWRDRKVCEEEVVRQFYYYVYYERTFFLIKYNTKNSEIICFYMVESDLITPATKALKHKRDFEEWIKEKYFLKQK
jgi:hypothetical protein